MVKPTQFVCIVASWIKQFINLYLSSYEVEMFQNQEVNYASDGNKYSRMYTEVEVKSHHHMLCVTKSFHS